MMSSSTSREGPVPPGDSLRILLVEDVAADAELLERELRRAGVRCATQRVQSGAELRHALHHFAPDLVLADDALPQFSALDALQVVQRERPLTPVIIVTGSLNEETAVSFIKEGAVDFVVKHRLFRLGPAVQRALALRRALEDAAVAETARHRAEEELRRQTEFLSHAQAAAGIGSWEWDIAGDCVTWSDETYRIFGVDPAAGPISYERYLELIHPDDRADVAAAVGWSLQTREPFALDHRIVRPDGSLHFLHGRGGIVTDASGRPVRMLGAVLDITSRKQAEEALRRANDRLNAVIQSSPLAISTLDADGVVRTWNPAAEQLFGWTADEVIGRPLPTVHGEAAEFEETRRRVMRGDPVSNVEVIRKKKDGTPVTVNLVAAPLHEADGRITGILGLIEDRTGVKRLEQQFFQAQKMEAVGRLAGGIAHDFNNLLTVITSYSDLLLEDLAPGDAKRDDLEQVRKAADGAAALTRQLLAFSRQQVVEPRVVSLNTVVEGLHKILRRVIGEDIELATTLAPDLGAVRADVGQLEQVLLDLAVNARDAMPTGGKLTIETGNVEHDPAFARERGAAAVRRFVMLAVTDTGVGMDEATKARIFEPFFTTKEPGKGTGLGL